MPTLLQTQETNRTMARIAFKFLDRLADAWYWMADACAIIESRYFGRGNRLLYELSDACLKRGLNAERQADDAFRRMTGHPRYH